VSDSSGSAAGTAFDFLGDGTAEAMYGDELTMFVFAGSDGHVVLSQARPSPTGIEYPVVADIDADGSAELLFVQAYPSSGNNRGLLVLQDREQRWVPAREAQQQLSRPGSGEW
jgi:hypothetical protein